MNIQINNIYNEDILDVLPHLDNKSISFIFADPPYNISKHKVNNFQKYDSGDTYRFGTYFIEQGDWDKENDIVSHCISDFYRVLKNSGNICIWYDIWKMSYLKDIMSTEKFLQFRMCKWEKNNPVPINSKHNYLSNATEYFLYAVKKGKATFESEYDRGVYNYPLCHGKERLKHPTQKPLKLCEEIILKHTKVGDTVLIPFAGSGSEVEACINTGRNYIAVEKDKIFYEMIKKRINH